MNILITSTSLQDTPGSHIDLLKSKPWNLFFLRGGIKGLGISQSHEKSLFEDLELPFNSLTYGIGYEKQLLNDKSIGFDYSYQSIGVLGDVSLVTIRFKLL